MNNEFTVTLGEKTLTLYSIEFKTDTRLSETATINSGIIRRLTGSRRNFYTLKGRTTFEGFISFCSYVNSLIGQSAELKVGGEQALMLILTKGECKALEKGMCEFTLELEEAE